MSLRSLQREVESLPDMNELLVSFKKHWIKPISNRTNKTLPFLMDLSQKRKAAINDALGQMDVLLGELYYAQLVNEKLQSLAHRGIRLQVAVFSHHEKDIKRLIHQLLRDTHSSLPQLVQDVNTLDLHSDMIQDLYRKTLRLLSKELNIKRFKRLKNDQHKEALKQIRRAFKKQRRTTSKVGLAIIKQLKELNNAKKNKKLFKP